MPAWDAVKEGDDVTPLVVGPIQREAIKAYGYAGGDTNPIHMDDKSGVSAGLGGVIAHGLYSMAHVARMMTAWVGPEGKLKRLDVQFRGMVRPGDMVTSKGKIVRKYQQGGERLVDVELVQEAKTPVARGKITQFEGIQLEWAEAATKYWLKGGDNILFEVVKEERTPDKKNVIEFALYRMQNSILGKATAVLK